MVFIMEVFGIGLLIMIFVVVDFIWGFKVGGFDFLFVGLVGISVVRLWLRLFFLCDGWVMVVFLWMVVGYVW